MKRIKFWAIAFTLLTSLTFTSCIDSGSGSNLDGTTYVTVQENSLYGGVTLLTDDGHKLIPSNPEVLKISATSYIKRAYIGIQWAEGVVFDSDRTKSYKMSIVAPLAGVNTEDYCNQPDTIKATYPLNALPEKGAVWGANGEYLSVIFKYSYQSLQKAVSFEMFPMKAENDQLTMKLCQTIGEKENYGQSDYMISFKLPTAQTINELLSRNVGVQGIEGGELTIPSNDSILVRVVAEGANSSLLQTDFVKIKIRK